MAVQPDSPKLPDAAPSPDEALRDACAQIYERLGRVEAALQRTEGIVADRHWDFAPIAFKRLERVEDMLRGLQRSLDDSTLQEMCVNLERQIVQTRMVAQRTETAVSGDSMREFCADIDARLMRTEDTIRRTENIVAGWRQELSPAMTRVVEIADTRRVAEDHESMAWPASVATPVVAGVMTLMIGGLIWASSYATPVTASRRPSSAPVAVQSTPAPTTVPVAASLKEPIAAALKKSPAPTIVESATAPVRESTAPVARLVSTPRVAAPARPQFVGTLSITSVPSGAAVSINGNPAGVTPLRLPRQRAGSMAVQIAQEGFERWSSSVRVPADKLTQVSATLRPIAQ